MMVQTLPVVDPNNPIDFTIAPPAVAGECFTATQRESISGDTSIPSAEVCTLPAAATYTFNICLDENGSNCSLDWEMVPAASRSTAPNGEIAPNGQIIFPNNAVWQTINIPLDVPGLTTPWLGGDGVVAPGGTGVYSIESMRFNKPACVDRFSELERVMSGANGQTDEELAERFISRVEHLGQQLGIPDSLNDLQKSDFETIAKKARKEAFLFYAVPRIMSRAECEVLLATIAEGATAP